MIRRITHIILLLILLALTALAGFDVARRLDTPPAAPTLHELYTALTDSTLSAILYADSVGDHRVADSLTLHLPDTLYSLLMAHTDDAWADTMLLRTYHQYAPWQKRQLLRALPEAKQYTEAIRTLRDYYTVECGDRTGWPYADIRMLDEADRIVSLSALVGRTDYVLVCYWASYSYPATRLLEPLRRLYAEAEGRIQLLMISLDQHTDAWHAYLHAHPMPGVQTRYVGQYPYISKDVYQVTDLPTLFLIDRQGTILLYQPSIEEIRETIN